jgi:ankyrin repeat protein
VVQCLLEHGADKDKARDNGATPLFIAAENGDLPVVQCLLEHGVDNDKVDNEGVTPLWIAAHNSHLPVVQFLVEQGADVKKADNEGWTPLHIAAQEGHKEIISCLVSWGASVTARTHPALDDEDDDEDEDEGLLPIDVTDDEEIKQLIRDEEKRHRDHGLKRAVILNPSAAEEESIKQARLEAMGDESEYEVQGLAGASAVSEGVSQGQASASAVAEEDDDDSGSDEPHEEAYLKSLKRRQTK